MSPYCSFTRTEELIIIAIWVSYAGIIISPLIGLLFSGVNKFRHQPVKGIWRAVIKIEVICLVLAACTFAFEYFVYSKGISPCGSWVNPQLLI